MLGKQWCCAVPLTGALLTWPLTLFQIPFCRCRCMWQSECHPHGQLGSAGGSLITDGATARKGNHREMKCPAHAMASPYPDPGAGTWHMVMRRSWPLAAELRSSRLDYTHWHGEKLREISLKAQGQAGQQELLETGRASTCLADGHWVAVGSLRTDQSGSYFLPNPVLQVPRKGQVLQ